MRLTVALVVCLPVVIAEELHSIPFRKVLRM